MKCNPRHKCKIWKCYKKTVLFDVDGFTECSKKCQWYGDGQQNISGDFKHVPIGLTPTNFQEILNKYIIPNSGFCINLSVDVS